MNDFPSNDPFAPAMLGPGTAPLDDGMTLHQLENILSDIRFQPNQQFGLHEGIHDVEFCGAPFGLFNARKISKLALRKQFAGYQPKRSRL